MSASWPVVRCGWPVGRFDVSGVKRVETVLSHLAGPCVAMQGPARFESAEEGVGAHAGQQGHGAFQVDHHFHDLDVGGPACAARAHARQTQRRRRCYEGRPGHQHRQSPGTAARCSRECHERSKLRHDRGCCSRPVVICNCTAVCQLRLRSLTIFLLKPKSATRLSSRERQTSC